MGMIFLPAIVSVGYYFTTKRAFATGVAVCGSGVGTFLFAPFCQYLLGVTSWQNTLFILSGMILLCAGFGALMKPLNVHAETVLAEELEQAQIQQRGMRMPLLQRIAEEKRRRLLAHSNSQFMLMLQNGSLDLNDLTFTELKERLTITNTEPGVHSTLYLDQLFQQSPTTPTPSASFHCSSTNQSQSQLAPEKHQLSPIIEKKIFSLSSSENSSEDITIKENNVNSQTDNADGDNEDNMDNVEQDKQNELDEQKLDLDDETKSVVTTPESPTSNFNR